jgi:hypothetical protein
VIEVTLGERMLWKDDKLVSGEQYEFVFASIEDARLVANAILAEVKACKAIDS